jgi:PTH1 family peptidyl-tRNA hydrolase
MDYIPRTVIVKVVVGLGNPGEAYERTPHNMGFMVVDNLAERLGCRMRLSGRFQAMTGSAQYAGQELLLVEPQTFMNESGRSVGASLGYRKLGPADLLVVADDADLPLGALRMRKKGSSGGHRGLESIAEVLGTNDFGRLRVGIGRGRPGADLVKHVLNAFGREEWSEAEKAVKEAADAVLCWIEHGAERAMNRFNTRRTESAGEKDVMAGGKEQ